MLGYILIKNRGAIIIRLNESYLKKTKKGECNKMGLENVYGLVEYNPNPKKEKKLMMEIIKSALQSYRRRLGHNLYGFIKTWI